MSQPEPIQRFAVSAASESETKTVVGARDFEFVVDEPAALDGTDDGPNPVEYLLGAWAGCLNVVAHTVAEERDIDLDGIDIGIEGDIDLRGFLQGDNDIRPGYQELRVTIEVDADAGQDTLDDFADAVEARCPVGDNIGNPTPTDIHLETT